MSCNIPGHKVLPCCEYDRLIARLNSAESKFLDKSANATKAKSPGAVAYFKKTKVTCTE